MSKPEHVIIVSLDAIGENDIKYMKTLENFSKFYDDAAFCDKVLGVYPTLTYPSHASIVTGLYPKNHGVNNNVLIQPNRKREDWMWNRSYIKGTTLYDEVKKNGGTVAAFLWPVTAKSKSIDYHIPEIFSNRWWDNQILTSLRNGSKIFQLKMFIKYGKCLKGIHQPELDEFTFNSALDCIRNNRPNLTLIHLTDLDTQKHYGNSNDVKRALDLFDLRLRDLIICLKQTGIYDKSTIVLLGDHSQLETDYIIYLNTFFKEKGWLKYDEKNKIIKDWKVLAQDCDGSCYIYIKREYIDEAYDAVKTFLEKIMATNKYGIEKIYTHDEAVSKGTDGEFQFMLEAKKGYYFQNEADMRIYRINKDVDGDKYMLATHGYDPLKENFRTIFAMNGVGVRPGELSHDMCLIDEAPTIAKLMGIEFPKVDGRVIKEFIIESEC